MTLYSTATVREVVLQQPQATRVFERMKIDYCCGGSRKLSEVCDDAGIDLNNLQQMIENESQSAGTGDALDFQSLTVSELIAHILDKHHVYTKAEMPRLEALIEKVVAAHGQNHPELLEIRTRFQTLCADLTPHMFKEEQILFPHLLNMERAATSGGRTPPSCFGTVNNPIRMMMMEHDTAGDILRDLRKLSNDYAAPSDSCMSYQTLYQAMEVFEKDLHQHIHLENNLLFPKAIELEVASFS